MRRLLLPILILIAGNLALLGTLRGHEFALLSLARDTDGRIFGAAPGKDLVAHAGNLALNYGVEFRTHIPVPAATGADHGIEDVRASVRWVRSLLSVGEDYHAEKWWLRDVVTAASEGRRRFMCDSYSRALVNASLRQGYAARVVMLDGHISGEIFLPEVGKWVFADALYDFVATSPEGDPLSIIECSDRVRRGKPVLWSRVTGDKGDDDELDPRNLARLTAMMEDGRFRIYDGSMGFGRLSRFQRARDLVLGRVHAVEFAGAGQPRADRDERAMRGLMVVWNAMMLGFAGLVMTRPGGLSGRAASPSR